MKQLNPSPKLTFRAARAADHPAIIEMTRDIWGGEDYLPTVWHEWLNTPNSHLRVGLLEGQLVASGRLVALAEGEWWLEGLRVHPAHQRKGLSSQLHFHLVELATQQPNARTLGLATSWRNRAITHLARQSGMIQKGNYRLLKRAAEGQAHPGVAEISAPADLRVLIHASAWGQQGKGYLMDGWVARRVTDGWVEKVLTRGARLWRYGSALAMLGSEPHRARWWLQVMVGGTAEEQRVLVAHLCHVARQQSEELTVRCLVPHHDPLIEPLLAAGFGDPWDGDRGPFHIYHFVLDT